MSLLHDVATLDREEMLFFVGVFYLDNRRLRRLAAKLAMRHFDMPDCQPWLPGELEDLTAVIAHYGRDVGADDKLMDQLARVKYPGKRRRR